MDKRFDNLTDYYNKFSEEKRLDSRHGQVEYRVSMKYIHEYLGRLGQSGGCTRVVDIGAGTGRYSVPLSEEGYDVTAVELVRYNLGMLKAKHSTVKALQGNAMDLGMLESEAFDMALLFGPMYHLFSFEDKLQALMEAKRVTKKGGIILVAYCMNEYSVITYAFKERHVMECQREGRIGADFHTLSEPGHLYDYVRVEDIQRLSEAAGLKRLKLISPDGPANYIRPFLNRLTEEEFECFVQYQMAVCERPELVGAAAHAVDILQRMP